MKKLNLALLALLFTATTQSFAQSTTDFFAGKWNISVIGSPRGDITFATDLVRKDGKLTGELVAPDDKRPMTKIEETATKLTLFFLSSQGGEISVELGKVDDDNLKGSLMGYDATAKRVKNTDFFAGSWSVLIIGTPDGDSKLVAELTRKDGTLSGVLKDPSGKLEKPIPIDEITEDASKITIAFQAQGYNLDLVLEKVDADNLKGSLMNGQFNATAKRIKE